MKNKRMLVTGLVFAFIGIVIVFTAASRNGQEPLNKAQGGETVQDPPEKNLPIMLELGSEGCKPCEQMKPVMAGLERDYGDRIRIVFHDVRKNPDIASRYGIHLIPTQIFLDSGGNEFRRHEGFFARDSILTVFRKHGVIL